MEIEIDAHIDLDSSWNSLADCDRIRALISLRFALSTPSALILDGPVPSIELESSILRLVKRHNIPLVWDGCSEHISRQVEHTLLVRPDIPIHPRRRRRKHHHPRDSVHAKSKITPPSPNPTKWCAEYLIRLVSFAGIALSCVDARKLGALVSNNIINSNSIMNVSGIKAPTPDSLTFHNGAIDIEWWRISTLSLILLCVIGASTVLSLEISTRLCIAAARCLIQLTVLGTILVPIIDSNSALIVLGYVCFMIVIAGLEASSRPAYIYPRLFLVCFLSIAVTVSVIGTFVFTLVIKTGLDARYVIPILGMLMGNSLSGISVGVSSILRDITDKLDAIEALLALGATRWEAALDPIKNSVVLALTPVLNTMSVVGLVVIPGMMTGQIIGGTSPSVAARYQIVIMYSISGGICCSTILSVVGTVLCITDNMHRFRTERLVKRNGVGNGSKNFVDAFVDSVWEKMKPRRQPFVALPVQTADATVNSSGNSISRYGSVEQRTDR